VASDTTATCTLCARPTRDTSNAKVESFHGIEGRIRGGEPPRMAVQLYEHQLSYEPGDFFFLCTIKGVSSLLITGTLSNLWHGDELGSERRKEDGQTARHDCPCTSSRHFEYGNNQTRHPTVRYYRACTISLFFSPCLCQAYMLPTYLSMASHSVFPVERRYLICDLILEIWRSVTRSREPIRGDSKKKKIFRRK
jgi:hypothetical protein